MEEVFLPLVTELTQRRTNMDRVIIYCRTYDSYLYLKYKLGDENNRAS